MRITALEQVDTHLFRGVKADGGAAFLAFEEAEAREIATAVNAHAELVALVKTLLPVLERKADAGPCMHDIINDWGEWTRLYMAARALLSEEGE